MRRRILHTALPNLVFCIILLATTGTLAFASESPGCGKTGVISGTYSMLHSGKVRRFRVHVPASYDNRSATPLVLIFHGWGGDENEFIGDVTVSRRADERGYILVAPRGLGSGTPDDRPNSFSFRGSTTGLDGDGNNDQIYGDTAEICDNHETPDYSYPSCADKKSNSCSWTHCQADDVDFALNLIEVVKESLCIETENIFATGGSNGGMFVWELGQNPASAPTFRAIAPLIGLPHRAYLDPPGKPEDLPLLLITGKQDPSVPPGGWDDPSFTTTFNDHDRYYYTGATAITGSWADSMGCNISRNAVVFEDGLEQVDCRSFCSDDKGWPRELDCRAEMGHSYELDWSWELILNFFDAHAASRVATGQKP